MDTVNAEIPGSLLGMAAHEVTGPDGAAFLVLQYQVGPALVGDPEAMQEFAAGMAGGLALAGATVRVGTLGGVEVVQGVGDGVAACAWTQGDLAFGVFGDDEDSVGDYTEALIQACDVL